MIYLMPCIAKKEKEIRDLEKSTGLTCHQLPGCTYAVLARSNVILFAKPTTRPPITFRNWNGGGDAA